MNSSIALSTVHYLKSCTANIESIDATAFHETCTYLSQCAQMDDVTECIRNGVDTALAGLLCSLPPPHYAYAEQIAHTLEAFALVEDHRYTLVLHDVPVAITKSLERFVRPSSTAALVAVLVPLSEPFVNKRSLLHTGILSYVTRYLDVYKAGDVALLKACCRIISNLVHDEESVSAADETETMEVLLQLWDTRAGEAEVVSCACTSLTSLLTTIDHQIKLLNYDVLPRCVTALQRHSDAAAVAATCHLIGALVTLPQASEVLGSLGGVRVVLSTLQNPAVCEGEALGSVCLALKAMCTNCTANVCDLMVDLKLLVTAAHDHTIVSSNAVGALALVGIFEHVVINYNGVHYASSCGVIDIIGRCLFSHLKSADHVRTTFRSLQSCAAHGANDSLDDPNAVPRQFAKHEITALVVSATQLHATEHDVVQMGLDILGRAALWPIPAIREALMGNTVPLMLSVTWQCLHNPRVVEAALQLMWSLCLDPEHRGFIVQQYYCLVSKVVRVALEMYAVSDDKVVEMGTGALWALTLDPRANAQLGHEGCLTELVGWLRSYMARESVGGVVSANDDDSKHDVVCLVLSNLWIMMTSLSNQKILIECGGLDVLAQLLRRHEGVLGVGGLATIYRTLKLTLVYPNAAKTLHTLRVHDTAVTHMKLYVESCPDLCECIVTLLWGIASATGMCDDHVIDGAVELVQKHYDVPGIIEGCLGVLWAAHCVGAHVPMSDTLATVLTDGVALALEQQSIPEKKKKAVADVFLSYLWAACRSDGNVRTLRMLFEAHAVELCVGIARQYPTDNAAVTTAGWCCAVLCLEKTNNSKFFSQHQEQDVMSSHREDALTRVTNVVSAVLDVLMRGSSSPAKQRQRENESETAAGGEDALVCGEDADAAAASIHVDQLRNQATEFLRSRAFASL